VSLTPAIRAWCSAHLGFGARKARQQAGMLKIKIKSSEQRSAEAKVDSFRRDLGPFVVAAETTRIPMAFTDALVPGHPIIFANDSFLELTGYDREEVLGQNFGRLIADGIEPAALAKLDCAFQEHSGAAVEDRYVRKDGTEVYAARAVSSVRDENGTVVQHFVSLIDLTEHRQDQQRSRILIDELNHRVKNTLAIVQSIVGHALRGAVDPEQIRTSIESRLFALSRSHGMLTRQDWRGVGLLDLIHAALEPFGAADLHAGRFAVSGENIHLLPQASLVLSIVLHELATNALKYGALSNHVGSIVIECKIERPAQGNRKLMLRWKEKDGPKVAPSAHKGFGSQMIEQRIAYELDGTARLHFAADGLLCTIEIDVPESGE
jgi:PAS domain S-box-containing protein